MRLQQQVANDSPSQLVSRTFRSVEAKVARRNSLASVPNLNESTEAGSPFALARRSLSAQLQLQEPGTMGMEISPMSDLANNLSSSSLSPSPWLMKGKPKKLAFALESSPEDNPDSPISYSAAKTSVMDSSIDSNASPAPMGPLLKMDSKTPPFSKDLLSSKDSTPLSSITNNPTRTKLQFGKKSARIPSSNTLLKPIELLDPDNKENQNPYSTFEHQLTKEGSKKRLKSSKRSLIDLMPEDEASRDSGIGSQPSILSKRHRSQDSQDSGSTNSQSSTMSMEELYQNLTPDQEGVSLLPESPEAKASIEEAEEGFNVNLLGTVQEEGEEEEEMEDSDSLGLGISPLQSMSFLNAPILASSSLSALPHKPALLRRAVSMKEPIRTGGLEKLGFKRPPPPNAGQERKKRRVEGEIADDPPPHGLCLPVFRRSVSETDLGIMKSCQVKEDTPDVLPDGSRLYCLPSVSHNQHRAITADTMADVLKGRYNHKLRNVRIIDCRYKFEFDGGHIRGAENWQHGEDDEFLDGFLPSSKKALPKAPPSYDAATYDSDAEEKRDILVFHCEFSSKRGPDYCAKLRTKDRNVNKDVYPGLHYPEVYLLLKGYKEFWTHHPDLCEGGYTEMDNPRFSNHLRTCRAKSKSWSGGTVSRTGRLSRMKL